MPGFLGTHRGLELERTPGAAEGRLMPQEEILRLIELSGGRISFAEIGRRLGISGEWARALAQRGGCDARRRAVIGAVYNERGRECKLDIEKLKQSKVSPRQVQLLAYRAMGKSYQEVADELGLSLSTVKNQVSHLMRRIGARHSAHALAIAVERGWIEIPKHGAES